MQRREECGRGPECCKKIRHPKFETRVRKEKARTFVRAFSLREIASYLPQAWGQPAQPDGVSAGTTLPAGTVDAATKTAAQSPRAAIRMNTLPFMKCLVGQLLEWYSE